MISKVVCPPSCIAPHSCLAPHIIYLENFNPGKIFGVRKPKAYLRKSAAEAASVTPAPQPLRISADTQENNAAVHLLERIGASWPQPPSNCLWALCGAGRNEVSNRSPFMSR